MADHLLTPSSFPHRDPSSSVPPPSFCSSSELFSPPPKPHSSSDPPPFPPDPAPNPSFPAPLFSSAAAPPVHGSVPAFPATVLPLPAPYLPVSALAFSSAASPTDIPPDLLCFQYFPLPPSPVEPPPAHLFPAAPEAPPAATPASAASPPSAFPQPSSSFFKRPPPAPATFPSVSHPPSAPSAPSSAASLAAHLSAHPADLQLRPQPVRRNAQATHLQPLSYAQATIGAPGSGFVRAHARDVNSFARLPRTGINVICGTREGIPAFSLVHSDMLKVEGLYAQALVMKFHGGRPSLAASHKEISCWGLESPFSIGPLTSKSFLLRFQDERDLLKILTRPSSTLITFPYKIYRWHSRCHKNEDSVMVPVWISLPRLPLQCFAPEFLESIANRIGRFLCLDKATATLARPSTARICIELDLRKTRPQCIWISLFEGFRQPIVYERLPKFCMGCHMQGHSNAECSKTPLVPIQHPESGLNPALQYRTPSARRNAEETLPSKLQDPPILVVSSQPPPADAPIIQYATSAAPHPPPVLPPPPAASKAIPASPSSISDPVAVPIRRVSHEIVSPSAAHLSALDPSQNIAIKSLARDPPLPVSVPSRSPSLPATPFLPAQDQPHRPPPKSSSPTSSNQQSPSSNQSFPPIRLMPRPRSQPVRSYAAETPPAAAPPLHHSQQQHPPPHSSIVRSKHKKSDPVYSHAFEDPHDPSAFLLESDSGASVEDNAPFGPHSGIAQEDESSFPQSYVSEGEELNVEPLSLQGHISDDAFYQRPKSSKRNKRHPDGPLKVQLRARKGSSSVHR